MKMENARVRVQRSKFQYWNATNNSYLEFKVLKITWGLVIQNLHKRINYAIYHSPIYPSNNKKFYSSKCTIQMGEEIK